MKTKKTIVTLLVLILMSNLGVAQSDYLKITRSDAENDFIKYPPGTTFQLKDENDKIVFSDTSSKRSFEIHKTYTLTVFPSYKSTSNTYKLSRGKIEIKNNKGYYEALDMHRKESELDYGTYEYNKKDFTRGLQMKKTLEVSTLNPKKYNGTFEFNNGIIASYNEGIMTATKEGKELNVEGRYLIYSEDGLIKLSFYPSNGETWWVFEPVKK